MKRRQFLRQTLAGLGGATVATDAARVLASASPSSANSAPAKNPFSTDPVARVKLTDAIETSRIGLGTGVQGSIRQSNMTRMNHDKALDIIRYAYDSGIRFFDCADLYGTHGIVAEALADKPRDSYALSSKIWPHPGGLPEDDRPRATVLVERFLKETKTDYLDLVQLHCMMTPDWVEKIGAYYFDDLEALKEKGLIRGHGVSCHSIGAIQVAVEHPWVDAVHIRMNTVNVRMEGTLEENVAAAETAQKNGKGVLCMKILGEGAIKNAAERKRSTDFVTRVSAVDVMVVGFEERAEIDEFLTNVGDSLKAIEAERKNA